MVFDAVVAREKAAVLDRVAALMGSHAEWPGADMLEWIADELNSSRVLAHPVSDQDEEALAYWRARAEAFGFEHDGEDEDDEDDDEGDGDA